MMERDDHDNDIARITHELPEAEQERLAGAFVREIEYMLPRFREHEQALAETSLPYIWDYLPRTDEPQAVNWIQVTPEFLAREENLILGRFQYLIALERFDLVDDLVQRFRKPGDQHAPEVDDS